MKEYKRTKKILFFIPIDTPKKVFEGLILKALTNNPFPITSKSHFLTALQKSIKSAIFHYFNRSCICFSFSLFFQRKNNLLTVPISLIV